MSLSTQTVHSYRSALKLRAFCHHQQPKDAFDILYTLRHYDGGSAAAITAFAEEVRAGNPACTDALRTLKEHFQMETSPGPVKASHFVLGQAQPSESEDTRFLRTTLRQDMVDAAAQLSKPPPHDRHSPVRVIREIRGSQSRMGLAPAV